MKSIPGNFVLNNDRVVCIKHFEKMSFIYTDKITSKNGQFADSRKYPKLADDALPKIFLGLPVFLSRVTPERNATT